VRDLKNIYRGTLGKASEHALKYLESLDARPVGATATLAELRSRLNRPLTPEGIPAEQVIDELAADADDGILASAGGRFFGWVLGGSVPAALAADWLTSAWDQNAGLYVISPAAAVVEEVCGAWLKDLFGLPQEASFALVTGCQMAHFTALAAARNSVLARAGWDVEKKGLFSAPPIRILATDQKHSTVMRAIRLLGLGTDCLTDLHTGADCRLGVEELRRGLESARGAPTIVILQAGDVNTGAYDPFAELIPLAHSAGAWVHVDGAFGLWGTASPNYRKYLQGVELADSWATDGHKWLNVPYDCGYAFVADPLPHKAAMTAVASYLAHTDVARDEMDWNPDSSRRARGFATYAAIRQLGRQGIADLVERCCRHAHTLVTRIGALEGAEMIWKPIINQGLVRFLDPRPGASPADHDRRTEAVTAAIVASGEAFFSGTTWRGMRCIRVSVSSWQTDEADVERVVRAVEQAIHSVGEPKN
jgi:glutamate/tyrosine decarboxylase-like PLP-dependent enzyme